MMAASPQTTRICSVLRVIVLLLGAAAGVAACSIARIEPTPAAGSIPWDAGRSLAWSDFRGAVDPRAAPERVAVTAASLSWGYDYKIERNGDACAYWITGVRAQAVFDQADSWVRPGHRNAAVLGHEQGHFDLTQIYKLILDRRMSALVGDRRPCEGDTLEKASRSAEARAAERARIVFEDVWRRHLSTQQAYDGQTRHGLETEAQALWTERIRRGLRLGTWDEPTPTRDISAST